MRRNSFASYGSGKATITLFQSYVLEFIIKQIVTSGFNKTFEILLDADATITNIAIGDYGTDNTNSMFVQPELYKDQEDENESEELDIMGMAVGGDPPQKTLLDGHQVYQYTNCLVIPLGTRLAQNDRFGDEYSIRVHFSLLSVLKELHGRMNFKKTSDLQVPNQNP